MTHSPTPTELLALRTANAALMSPDSSYDFASTIVFALGSAQLLQSPETAAELARLQAAGSRLPVDDERIALIRKRRTHCEAVRFETEDERPLHVWGPSEYPGRDMCQRCTTERAWAEDVDADEVVLLAEVDRLRARVAELETERHSTNEALSDAAEQLRQDRDRFAELEAERGRPAPMLTPAMGSGQQRLVERTMAELEARHWQRLGLTPPAGSREDSHDSPLHHDYKHGRDLEFPQQQEAPRG